MPSVDAQHKKEIILLASSTQQQKFITFSSGRRTMRSRQRDPIQSTRGKACTGKEFPIPQTVNKIDKLARRFYYQNPETRRKQVSSMIMDRKNNLLDFGGFKTESKKTKP
jgi:hypothetical protein